MDRQAIISELESIIGDYLKMQGLDLVELIYRYTGNALFLRILVDKPEGGISLDECAHLNNQINKILEERDILQENYILEVFSPGVDRPLVTKADFLRCINRSVKFFLTESVNGRKEWEGTIYKVDDDSVYIDIDGECIGIPLAKIAKARQVIG